METSELSFFIAPQKISPETIGVCIIRELGWAENGHVILRTEG